MEVIKEIFIKKSRKHHNCDGAQQIERNVDEHDENHKTAWDQYKACCDIQKGEGYYKQIQRDGGELGDFKCCVGCWREIEKFKFYEND